MKNQKTIVRILCIVLSVLMVLSIVMMVIPVRAVTQTEIQALEEKRAALENELQAQAEVVRALSDNHALIIDRKAALDRQIALKRESIALLEEQLAAYDEMIAQKERELSDAKTAEEEQSSIFRSRMRAMEEGGSYSYVSYIFASDSITDLLSRMGDINDIMHFDRQLEESLILARAEVEKLKREFEEIQLEKSAVYAELDAKRTELDAQIAAACTLIAELDARSDDAEREYAAIEAAEAQAYAEEQRAIAAYAAQQEAARLAALAAQSANQAASVGSFGSNNYSSAGSGYVSGNGSFIWPTDSTYITSNYGYRNAPTAGASTYHQAVDISAPAGTPIYAAADGQVAVATYNNGLGNYVSIVHDGDTSTRYSHMTNYVVQPGEYVTQGQIIGYVGSTGIATGDHLDFAVTQNGQSVDPLQFYDSSGLVFDPTA